MAGLLTVVNPDANPRRGRRHKSKRRRKANASRPARRRRRRNVLTRSMNPRRRRRVGAHRRRRANPRRRRHANPFGVSSGVVGTLTSGLALGAGAIGTNIATAGVNHLLGAKAVTGPMKIALKGLVGLIALPMVLKFVPGGGKFANKVRLGAGIAIAIDIYEQYLKPSLPAYLQDYQYGSLQEYRQGTLQGWAPQPGMSGAGSSSDDSIYD